MPSKQRSGFWDEMRKSVLLIPSLVVLLCLFVVPIMLTIYYSFTNMALSGSNAKNFQFVGLENYVRMLTDPTMLVSIKNKWLKDSMSNLRENLMRSIKKLIEMITIQDTT